MANMLGAMRIVYRRLLPALVAAAAACPASAQNLRYDPTIFTSSKWVQVSPDYSYLNGCVTGYRAFDFSDTGYFTLDNKVHGDWKEGGNGNITIRIRLGPQEGQSILLIFDGTDTLQPNVPSNTTTDVPPNPADGSFTFRHYDRFRKCAAP